MGLFGTATRLIDRGLELSALESLFAQASTGRLTCGLIVGEPGAGKTLLTQTFLEQHQSDALCLSATGHPFGATTSFGLWMEALDTYLARLRSETNGTGIRLTPHQHMLMAAAQLLGQLAARSPVIILLDDVHLADASSWEALAFVARNLKTYRILVLACGRTAELALDHRATAVTASLEQEGALTRLPLLPLGKASTEQLIESRLQRRPPAALVDWIFDQSRGNALFIVELLQGLEKSGVNLVSPALAGLPEGIIEQVRLRLADVPERSRPTLDALAVAARSLPLGQVAELEPAPISFVGDVLQDLVRHQLVIERVDGPELAYEISHPLVREAIYELIPVARRQGIHHVIARSLVRQQRLAEASMHYVRGASAGETEAVDTLIQALHQSEERQSAYEAMAVLEGLLTLLPPGDPRWGAVLDAMVWDADWLLDYNGFVSAEVGLRALREIERSLPPSSDPLRRAVVQLRLTAFSLWDTTRADAIARDCREAIAVFEQRGQSRAAMMAHHWLAWLAGISGDLGAMEKGAARVTAMAENAGDQSLIMHAQSALGWTLLRQGRFAEGKRAFERSTALAQAAGNINRLLLDLSSLAYLEALGGQLEEAQMVLSRARTIRASAADARMLASISLLAGDVQGAFDNVRADATHPPAIPGSQHAWALVFAVIAAARLRRFEEASTWLESSSRYQGRVAMGWDAFREWAAGVLAGEQGDLKMAVLRLQQAADDMRQRNYRPASALVLSDAIDFAYELGDVSAVLEAADGLKQIATQLSTELYSVLATLGAAYVASLRDDPAALPLADEAARAFDRLGYREWEARALDLKASRLSRTDRHTAIACYQQILTVCSVKGTIRRQERARRALLRLGRAGRHAMVAGAGASRLSSRERDVIRLVIDGLTAAAIGGHLHISRRTVESHLANAYAKLGVQSRFELLRRRAELRID